MSTTKNNAITKNYKGKFADQLVFRNRYGKSIMAGLPKQITTPPTANQLNVRRKFLLASRYAKNVMQDPVALAAYKAKVHDGLSPYVLAMSDYLKPPYVTSIDTSAYTGAIGDKILVIAGDNFAVVNVGVSIIGPNAVVVEHGLCTYVPLKDRYEYSATVAVPTITGLSVVAKATDTPGNTTELTQTL